MSSIEEGVNNQTAPYQPFWHRFLTFYFGHQRILFLLATLFCIAIIPHFFYQYYFIELLTHFQIFYAGLTIMGLCLCFTRKKNVPTALYTLLLIIYLSRIVPLYLPADRQHDDANLPIKILQANVLTSNKDHLSLIKLIQKENPDIIFLQETNHLWQKALKPIMSQYPHTIKKPRDDNFGLLLLSKYPLENSEVKYFADAGVPSVLTDVKIKNLSIQFIGTHPLPPISQPYYLSRNRQIMAIAKFVKENKKPTIVSGDFNITMWSPIYMAFKEDSQLTNSRKGFGIKPTWPQGFVYQIPIDHCFVSSEITVKSCTQGQNINSDHLPLITEIALPATEKSAITLKE